MAVRCSPEEDVVPLVGLSTVRQGSSVEVSVSLDITLLHAYLPALARLAMTSWPMFVRRLRVAIISFIPGAQSLHDILLTAVPVNMAIPFVGSFVWGQPGRLVWIRKALVSLSYKISVSSAR